MTRFVAYFNLVFSILNLLFSALEFSMIIKCHSYWQPWINLTVGIGCLYCFYDYKRKP